MKIGIIGAGRIAHVHARSVADNPETTLTVVADPVQEAADSLAALYGARATTSAEELIANPEVEAVIICSPTPFHAPQVLGSVKAGKAVLCEKPLAGSLAEAEALVSDLEGLEPRVLVGFNRRFDPSFSRTRKVVDEGTVGPVEQVTIISRDPKAPPKEYMASSGGIFADMTIHDFDMARFMLGDFTHVSATGQNLDPELADSGDFDGAVTVLTTRDGKTATITNSRHCATGYDQRIEVFGPKGAVFVENVRPDAAQVSTAGYSAAESPYLDFFLERYTEAYARELEAFVEGTRGKKPLSPTLVDGVESLRLAEAAAVSANERRRVCLK